MHCSWLRSPRFPVVHAIDAVLLIGFARDAQPEDVKRHVLAEHTVPAAGQLDEAWGTVSMLNGHTGRPSLQRDLEV